MRCFVYVLKRPCGEPFYVGKGTGDRAGRHAHEAKRHAGINPHKERLVRKILQSGQSIQVEIRAYFETDADAFVYETMLIKEIGRHDLGEGPLTNKTNGGDGVAGNLVTEETRARLAAGSRAAWNKPERLAAASRKMSRQWVDKKFRKLRSDQFTEQRNNVEFEKARSEGHRRKMSDPAYLSDLSRRATQQWADPEFRRQASIRSSEQATDPERVRHNSESAKARWLSGHYDGQFKAVLADGRPYRSIQEAATALGVTVSAVSARLKRYDRKNHFPEGWGYLGADFDWSLFQKAAA